MSIEIEWDDDGSLIVSCGAETVKVPPRGGAPTGPMAPRPAPPAPQAPTPPVNRREEAPEPKIPWKPRGPITFEVYPLGMAGEILADAKIIPVGKASEMANFMRNAYVTEHTRNFVFKYDGTKPLHLHDVTKRWPSSMTEPVRIQLLSDKAIS